MKIKVYSLKTECIMLEMLLAVLICVGNFFQLSSFISLAFLCTFAVLVFLSIKQSHGGKVNKELALLVLLSVLNVVINALISPAAHFNLDYIKKLIMFISAITFFVLIRDAEITIIDKRMAYWFGIILAALFPIAYFALNIHTMLGKYLTMGFTNPNFTAFWILHGFLFTAIAFFKVDKIWLKSLFVIIAIGNLYIASLTLNRAIWIVITCFFVLLLYGIIWRKRSLPPVIIAIIVILPIIIVMLYHAMLENAFFQKTFSFMVSEGKGLNSRTLVWDLATEKLRHAWVLGDYSGISNGTGISQMHNTHLDVICSYGLIPFCLFVYILGSVAMRLNERSNTIEQYVSICSFLAVILFGIFEAALFSGCTGLNYLTGAFLILAKTSTEEDSN